jgi:hypothetical protein
LYTERFERGYLADRIFLKVYCVDGGCSDDDDDDDDDDDSNDGELLVGATLL